MPTAFAAAEIDVDELIDIDEFPIHELTSASRAQLVGEAQTQMAAAGCFRISGFIRPEAVELMCAEALGLHDATFWSQLAHNPYFTDDDVSLAPGDPRRTFQQRHSGFISADILTTNSVLRRLYDCDVLLHFAWARRSRFIAGLTRSDATHTV